jgi:hypothetical protein
VIHKQTYECIQSSHATGNFRTNLPSTGHATGSLRRFATISTDFTVFASLHEKIHRILSSLSIGARIDIPEISSTFSV